MRTATFPARSHLLDETPDSPEGTMLPHERLQAVALLALLLRLAFVLWLMSG